MRVLLVSQQFPSDSALGGIGSQAAAKASGLRRLGHDVHVLSQGPVASTDVRDDGVVVTRLAPTRLTVHTTAAAWLAHGVEVAEAAEQLAAREGPFDLIDVPDYGAEGMTLAANRAPGVGPPVAVHVHGTTDMLAHHLGWPEPGSSVHRVGGWLEREAMRAADRVFASSAFSAAWVVEALGWSPEQIPVWHCGVDTTAFTPGGPGAAPMVAFVGRVGASKGVDVLLAAAERARTVVPDLVVRLIGRVDPDGERLLAERDVGAVEVLGPLPREELAAALEDAWAFAVPSRFEAGPGLVYLEAMACGLPVVACDVGGVGEAVIDGVTGRLVPPDDVGALAGALTDLLSDRVVAARLAGSARDWVVANADTARLMPKLVEIYETVAS